MAAGSFGSRIAQVYKKRSCDTIGRFDDCIARIVQVYKKRSLQRVLYAEALAPDCAGI
jgi:hypothetical protein